MELVKRYIWEVIPMSTPLFKRKCSKCKNSDLYYNSNKFRLNSQKKIVDVWLIYRCIKCDNTCNITILSRTKPELIDKDLYQRFMMNDEDTARKYAFDPVIMRKNNMNTDHSRIEYEIICEDICLHQIAGMHENKIEFVVKSEFNIEMKLSSLIRKCWDISSKRLDEMLEKGVIEIQPEAVLRKSKVRDGIVVAVYRKRLKEYLYK